MRTDRLSTARDPRFNTANYDGQSTARDGGVTDRQLIPGGGEVN